MHETSLIQNLFDIVREQYPVRSNARILSVTLECGALSNIEPILLKEAFDVMRTGTEFATAELRVESVPTEARCRHCQLIYQPEGLPFVCPECGEWGGEVIRGHDLILKHIEMEVSENG